MSDQELKEWCYQHRISSYIQHVLREHRIMSLAQLRLMGAAELQGLGLDEKNYVALQNALRTQQPSVCVSGLETTRAVSSIRQGAGSPSVFSSIGNPPAVTTRDRTPNVHNVQIAPASAPNYNQPEQSFYNSHLYEEHDDHPLASSSQVQPQQFHQKEYTYTEQNQNLQSSNVPDQHFQSQQTHSHVNIPTSYQCTPPYYQTEMSSNANTPPLPHRNISCIDSPSMTPPLPHRNISCPDLQSTTPASKAPPKPPPRRKVGQKPQKTELASASGTNYDQPEQYIHNSQLYQKQEHPHAPQVQPQQFTQADVGPSERVWTGAPDHGHPTSFGVKQEEDFDTKQAVGPSMERQGFQEVHQPTPEICIPVDSYLQHSTWLETTNGLHQYQLPLQEMSRCNHLHIRNLVMGQAPVYTPQRTFLMVGETGSGKSTMIDGLINFMFDVKLSDDFRFRIISTMGEDAPLNRTAADSQTDWITCYTIHPIPGGPVKDTINIIDTPGFGDTRGVERDKEIVNQLSALFKDNERFGVDCLHAVCFLLKASTNRLTASIKYVIDAVFGLFGKDLEQNIYALCSYYDGSEPVALQAMYAAGVKYQQRFFFNNLWMLQDNSNSYVKSHYDSSRSNALELFDEVGTVCPKSLTMSVNVLEERALIQDSLESFHQLASVTAGRYVTVKRTQEELELKRECIITIPVLHKFAVQTKTKNMNCIRCHLTCKTNVGRFEGFMARRKSARCRICECLGPEHKTQMVRYEARQVTEEKKYEELQDEYGEHDLGAMIQKLDQECAEMVRNIEQVVLKMKASMDRLNDIALKPKLTAFKEYYDILIVKEESEMKPGFDKRVSMLQKLKQNADLLNHITEERFDATGFINTQL